MCVLSDDPSPDMTGRPSRGRPWHGVEIRAHESRSAASVAQERPRLETNEAYVEEVGRTTALQITDPTAVLAFVLEGLPSRVKVYPTENYYYFRFVHNGTPYAGNIRLAPSDRDQGNVEFDYYKQLTEWNGAMDGAVHAVLDASHGVQVERLEPLIYRVTCANRVWSPSQ
jgi:hypothetical protein